MSTPAEVLQVLDSDSLSVLHDGSVEFSCNICGNVLAFDGNLWTHECMNYPKNNEKSHVFDIDANNKIKLVPRNSVNTSSKSRNAPNTSNNRQKVQTLLIDSSNSSATSNESINEALDMDLETELCVKQILISSIKSRPIIWNHVNFRVEQRKAKLILDAWVAISKELGVTVQYAQDTWKELKSKYKNVKELKDKYKASGVSTDTLGAVQKANIDFPLYDDMAFINDFIEPIQTTDSLSTSPANADDTVAQYQRLTKTTSKKRCNSASQKEEASYDAFHKDVMSLLKENKDPEEEELSAYAHQLKHGLKRIPAKHRFDVQILFFTVFADQNPSVQ
ncbi:hypothetical protein QAD02_009610 [Eretmocerus hayati]|uniref:Uncharacterized protein n=1 Tax=Eretmocerus hayati TaxID=131215 RepID=A0ACC2NC75_9HYME|nr:hypothetical protein QAD02_009610 [Eretmocerus hayati]